jgi:hypothetical protein
MSALEMRSTSADLPSVGESWAIDGCSLSLLAMRYTPKNLLTTTTLGMEPND